MASKSPESLAPPTLKQFRAESAPIILKKTDSPALGIEGAASELAIICKMGENPNSASRFLRLLCAIRPADVDALVPGTGISIRTLLEQLAFNSIHSSVRLAAIGLLEPEIIVVQSDTAVPGAGKVEPATESFGHPPSPAFSRLPIRVQALELLRGHVEGTKADIPESELKNAIDALKFEKDAEVAGMLAHVASFSPNQSIREIARAVLCDF